MKAFYREWGRCWLLITWGRYPEPLHPDQYAADDAYPAHIECPEAHMGNVISAVGAQSFEAIKEAHEDSPQAIGSFLDEVVRLNELEHAGKLTESEVDRAIVRAKNWVDQERDGS